MSSKERFSIEGNILLSEGHASKETDMVSSIENLSLELISTNNPLLLFDQADHLHQGVPPDQKSLD
jgi:hypothetical protein